MRPESLKLFAKLMENGYITREQSPSYYEYYNDPEIASELAIMEQELDFTLYKTNGRLYLLPDPNNELFSQDNNDFRRSVGKKLPLMRRQVQTIALRRKRKHTANKILHQRIRFSFRVHKAL